MSTLSPNLEVQAPRERASLVARLDDSRFRRRVYAILAVGFFCLGWLVSAGKAVKKHEYIDFVFSDAEGYYVYLPSLLLDHDLDFRNQLTFHATMQSVDNKAFLSTAGDQRNRWPIGVALTLAPAFVAAHVVALGLHSATSSVSVLPSGYSLPYQLFCSASALAVGCWGMCLADGMIAREFRLRGRSIAAAVLVYWVGTNYAYYFFREPLMAHLISSTWVIVVASTCQRIIAAAREARFVAWHWPLLSAAMSMAVICRFTNASLLPLLLIAAAQVIRGGQLGRAAKYFPLILLGAAPILLQLLIWRQYTGGAVANNLQQIGYQSQERFYWSDPALIKTLISSRHGLFFWSPALIVSVVGLAFHFTRGEWRNSWLVGLTASALLLWYLNSAWYAWGFGYSFGARAFLEMAGLFITGFALAFDHLATASARLRWSTVTFVALTIGYSYCMMTLYIFKVLPRDDFLIPRPGIKPPPGLDSYYRPYIAPSTRRAEAK